MKRIWIVVLFLLLVSCSATETDTLEVQEEMPSTSIPEVGEYMDIQREEKSFPILDNIPVDIDFTELGTTIAYSMCLMMMYEPEEYWEKTYRIQGTYMYEYFEEFGEIHLILLMDETNCCQGVLEFFLEEGLEYPPNGAEFALVGEYILVDEDALSYSVLQASHIAF